jgi:hypothetical protein
MFCKEQAVQLHRDRSKFEAAGANLVVIGNGAPHFIDGFRKETGFEGPLYTDPSLRVYELAEMKRGLAYMLNPMLAFYAIRGLARGFMQTKTKGDKTQQGGVVVVLPDGSVPFHHADSAPGDLAKNSKILAVLEKNRTKAA